MRADPRLFVLLPADEAPPSFLRDQLDFRFCLIPIVVKIRAKLNNTDTIQQWRSCKNRGCPDKEVYGQCHPPGRSRLLEVKVFRRTGDSLSIIQHRAMFDRFTRNLVEHGLSLSTFGTDHVDSFPAPSRASPKTRRRRASGTRN
ncbi:hypothetical protein [Pararobbsia alpina]|uniref:hypothetical protein n=1 Tax=Pararobbsia alpina TaxID=621374 RepID=UPI0015816F34|nr:hypothetical protein [Pararobbsia alpina]